MPSLKRRIFSLGFAILMAVLSPSCVSTAEVTHVDGVILEQGITYSGGVDFELKLDLARAETGRGPFPALLFLCGSGWGFWPVGRMDYHDSIIQAAQRGYVAVSVDYRSTSIKENGKAKFRFPSQLYDVKRAVRWLRANSAKYNIDPNRIGAAGYSSGGHLALMLGLTTPSDGLEGESDDQRYSSDVQAVVNSAGPTELVSMYSESSDEPGPVVDLMGGTPRELSAQYAKASPVTYARKGAPPILTIHGDADQDVPPKQAYLLDIKMREVDALHILIIKKNFTHTDFIRSPEVLDFFDKYLTDQR